MPGKTRGVRECQDRLGCKGISGKGMPEVAAE